MSGAWTCQESFFDSWITPHVVKPFIKTSRFFFAFFFLSHFFASLCYSNMENQARFSIEYGLSVGSKCNSLKTNQAFKNKLGCPRASHYLTPPPTRYFLGRCPRIKRSNVHLQPVSLKWLASV